MKTRLMLLTCLAGTLLAGPSGLAHAGSRLLATGGVSQFEGSAGGGLTPWALIAGYGTADEIGAAGFTTRLHTNGGFGLNATGFAVGFRNRLEVSAARLRFGLGTTVPGAHIGMAVFGLKVRVSGDAVYDQHAWWPQIALGLQHKRNLDFSPVPDALGASDRHGTDVYVSATKLWLAAVAGRNLLTNLTVRNTSANQFGLLGFGGDQGGRQFVPEASVALFLDDNVLLGAEYRARPDNLSSFAEEDAYDLFATWFFHRSASLTLAHLHLGRIADKPDQKAWYLSFALSF